MHLLDIIESLNAPTPTVEDLAKKYNVPESKVKAQLSRGVKVEKEHTSNTKEATEIALDHLGEDLHYYTKLAKAQLEEAEQMELPGIPTPQQAMSQSNLKQYGQPSWRATTPTAVDGQGEHQGSQVRVTSLYKLSPRDNFIINGKAEITTPDGQKMVQPWSLVVQRKTGAVLAKNVGKLDDFSLDAVFNHITTAGLMRKQYANPLQNDPNDAVMEEEQNDQSMVDKETPDQEGERKHPRLFYQGLSPKVKQLINTAYKSFPDAKNDVEAVFSFIQDQQELNRMQQGQLEAEQELVRSLQAELENVEIVNDKQAQQIQQLVAAIQSKEQRFQQYTDQVAQQQMSAQQAAQGAQAIAQQPVAEQTQGSGIRKHYFRVDSMNTDIAQQIGLKQDRGGNWVLYQTPQSGARFDRIFSDAVRAFGHPTNSHAIEEGYTPKKKDSSLIDALRDFLPIAVKHLKLDHIPKIKLEKHIEGTHVPTFGRFGNDTREISVVVSNRHPVDILRTLAHEMVHYKQELLGQLDGDSWHTGSPDEDEANAEGGVIMRLFNQAHPEYLDNAPITVQEAWSKKYKKSINCNNPKGFSQRAHCAGRRARQSGKKTKSSSVSESIDNIEIIHEPSGRGHYIEARLDGQEVGRVWFNPTKGGYRASMAWVSQNLRRQGIARKMYQYARDNLGLDIVPSDVQSDDARAFWATNPVEENFADGKKPGRKGLAKRSGVNCKASVTQLRKVAKNSTGEKRRMAHWCANMKSGRSKG